jgi:hypothetical protein
MVWAGSAARTQKMHTILAAACVLASVGNTASFPSAPVHSVRITLDFPMTEYPRSLRLRKYAESRLAISNKVQNGYNGETAGYPLQPTYTSTPEGMRTCWVRYFYEGKKPLWISLHHV